MAYPSARNRGPLLLPASRVAGTMTVLEGMRIKLWISPPHNEDEVGVEDATVIAQSIAHSAERIGFDLRAGMPAQPYEFVRTMVPRLSHSRISSIISSLRDGI